MSVVICGPDGHGGTVHHHKQKQPHHHYHHLPRDQDENDGNDATTRNKKEQASDNEAQSVLSLSNDDNSMVALDIVKVHFIIQLCHLLGSLAENLFSSPIVSIDSPLSLSFLVCSLSKINGKSLL